MMHDSIIALKVWGEIRRVFRDLAARGEDPLEIKHVADGVLRDLENALALDPKPATCQCLDCQEFWKRRM